MTARVVVLEVSLLEAAHLAGMVRQFVDLLEATDTAEATPGDPAVARLVPDAYTDDAEASAEFRRLTSSDLLGRRRQDAEIVLATLSDDGVPDDPALLDEAHAARTLIITLDDDETSAWMRTLTSLRLVLASRLDIESEDDHDDDDPRFGVYEWLGVRLEGLIHAADTAR